jgi:hypothetical protein
MGAVRAMAERPDAMGELGPEAGTTTTRRRWLLPLLSVACSALSFVAFCAYGGLHATLIRPLQPNEMVWLVDLAGGAANLLAYVALALALAAVIKGRRWQRVAGLVAIVPALAVCAVSQVTF